MVDESQDKTIQEETAKSDESEATGAVESTLQEETKEGSISQQTPSEAQKTSTEPKTSEQPKPAPKPVSANLEKIIEQIEKLSVLELADLVHALEERFGVSASAPVAVAGASSATGAEPTEEKTTFNVVLTAAGANKIAVIKAVRELVQTLGLKEAKDLVESAPKPVLESVNKQTAEGAKIKLTAAGATVELQ